MKRVALGLLLFAMILAQGCRTPPTDSLRSQPLNKYPPLPAPRILQIGDRVMIHLRGIPKPEDLVEVIDDRGNITLPLLTVPVRIGGFTTGKAEAAIVDAYVRAGIYLPDAVNAVVVPPETQFYVTGYVNRPGAFSYGVNITVQMALSMAGGINEFGEKDYVELIRNGQTQRIALKKILHHEVPNPYIEAGDIIKVLRGWM